MKIHYTIRNYERGFAIIGPISLTELTTVIDGLARSRGYTVCDCEIAQKLGASIVFTSPEGAKLWKKELDEASASEPGSTTDAEIDQLNGSDLSFAVASRVMGWDFVPKVWNQPQSWKKQDGSILHDDCFTPHKTWDCVGMVLDEMSNRGFRWSIESCPECCVVFWTGKYTLPDYKYWRSEDKDVKVAICRAALKAVAGKI